MVITRASTRRRASVVFEGLEPVAMRRDAPRRDAMRGDAGERAHEVGSRRVIKGDPSSSWDEPERRMCDASPCTAPLLRDGAYRPRRSRREVLIFFRATLVDKSQPAHTHTHTHAHTQTRTLIRVCATRAYVYAHPSASLY